MLSRESLAMLDAFFTVSGNPTRQGQARLIRVLELTQRLSPADLGRVLSEIRELNPEA